MSNRKSLRSPGWKRNGHWVECQRTGKAVRAYDARKEWTGLIVAKEEWESRHPQDFLRSRKDDQSPVGLVQPESAVVFDPTESAVAGVAITGVAIAGTNPDSNATTVPEGTFLVDWTQVAPA